MQVIKAFFSHNSLRNDRGIFSWLFIKRTSESLDTNIVFLRFSHKRSFLLFWSLGIQNDLLSTLRDDDLVLLATGACDLQDLSRADSLTGLAAAVRHNDLPAANLLANPAARTAHNNLAAWSSGSRTWAQGDVSGCLGLNDRGSWSMESYPLLLLLCLLLSLLLLLDGLGSDQRRTGSGCHHLGPGDPGYASGTESVVQNSLGNLQLVQLLCCQCSRGYSSRRSAQVELQEKNWLQVLFAA